MRYFLRSVIVTSLVLGCLIVLGFVMLATWKPLKPGNLVFIPQYIAEQASALLIRDVGERALYYVKLAEQRGHDLSSRAGGKHELIAAHYLADALGQLLGAVEHTLKHLNGKPSGLGILSTGVIRADEPNLLVQSGLRPMPKFGTRNWQASAQRKPGMQHRLPGNSTQSHDDLYLLQLIQFLCQEWSAGEDLYTGRFILRRDTVKSSCNIGITQLQTVIRMCALRLIAEAITIEGCVEEVAAAVSRENPSCTICSVGAGR